MSILPGQCIFFTIQLIEKYSLLQLIPNFLCNIPNSEKNIQNKSSQTPVEKTELYNLSNVDMSIPTLFDRKGPHMCVTVHRKRDLFASELKTGIYTCRSFSQTFWNDKDEYLLLRESNLKF